MIDFKKYLKSKVKQPQYTMPLYNDNGDIDVLHPYTETSTSKFRPQGLVFIFEGYWSYYLSDLIYWIKKIEVDETSTGRMYLDVGRGFYVLVKDVKRILSEMSLGTTIKSLS